MWTLFLANVMGNKKGTQGLCKPLYSLCICGRYPLNSRLQLIFIFYAKFIKSLTVAAVYWQFVWIFAIQWLMFLDLHIEKGTAESLAQWFCYYDRRCGSSLEYYSYILVKR